MYRHTLEICAGLDANKHCQRPPANLHVLVVLQNVLAKSLTHMESEVVKIQMATLREAEPHGAPDDEPARLTVKVFRHLEEIDALRDWWSSLPGHRDSDIDVHQTICHSSPNVLSPLIFVLFRGEKPDAILIGRVVQTRFDFRIGYFSLFKPVVRVMMFSYGGLRGNACPENCETLVREIMRSLKSGDADLALLDHSEKGSPLFNCALRMPGFFFRDHLPSVQLHWIMELPSTIEQLYANLSYNQRSHFRKTSRKLMRSFPDAVRFKRLTDSIDLDRTLQDVEEIAKRTYQRKLNVGFTNSAPQREFLKKEAEMGWLRVDVLYLANKPVAFWIGAVYQNTFFSDFTGYDPDYTQHAPGTCLLTQILEEFCSENIAAVDFGFSDNAYKERICTVVKHEASLHLFASTLKGFRLAAMRASTSLVHEALKTLLQRTDLIQNVKKMWRRIA